MPEPLPEQPPTDAGQRPDHPTVLEQIGIDTHGNPLFKYRDHTPVQQPAPLRQHPVGAYLAAGCFGLIALVVIAAIVIALIFGLAILAVALTICVLVLYGIWRDIRSKKQE